MVAEIARKIKRYFINDAKSFGSCSLHPYSFRWVTIALSYGDSLGAGSTQFTIRNLMFPKSGELLLTGHRVETAKQLPRWIGPRDARSCKTV